jgi:hypothetical protein
VIVACQVEEHVMASAVFVYGDGLKLCSGSHESERGRYDLSVDGDPPEVFPALCDGLSQQQDGGSGSEASVDFVFDVPVQLAAALCVSARSLEVRLGRADVLPSRVRGGMKPN